MAKPIHQEVTFTGTPEQFYDAYMSSAKRAEYTGAKAEISADEGGAFSCHEGQIVGRNLELANGKRIVQAWRVAGWPDGLYTTVHMELTGDGSKTTMVMDHYGVPDQFEEHIAAGWHKNYWEPMQKFLG